jgi:tetratricopeptide (TPR) repeat protein
VTEFLAALENAEARERAGDWTGAAQLYALISTEALERGDVARLVECLRKGARASHLAGRVEEAGELARASLEIATRTEMAAAAARALNQLALQAHSAGRLEEAREAYTVALERARESDDAELIGAACQNLGVLANMRGDLREARALYFECVGTFVRSGARLSAMAAYNNLGMVCCDLHEWLEAEIYFGRGIEIATQVGNAPMLAKLLVNHAEPLIEFGELDHALESLRRAELVAEHLEDACLRVDMLRFRARIGRIRGDFPEAERLLHQALHTSRDAGLQLEEAEVREEMAHLRWAQGRRGPARMLLREAGRLFAEIGAEEDFQRLQRVSRSWSPLEGSAGPRSDDDPRPPLAGEGPTG